MNELAQLYMQCYHDMNHDISMLMLSGIHIPREKRWEHLEKGLNSIQQKYIDKIYNFTNEKAADNTEKMRELYQEAERLDKVYGNTFTVTTIDPAQTEVVRIVETDNGW